jgi:hypothetical protein
MLSSPSPPRVLPPLASHPPRPAGALAPPPAFCLCGFNRRACGWLSSASSPTSHIHRPRRPPTGTPLPLPSLLAQPPHNRLPICPSSVHFPHAPYLSGACFREASSALSICAASCKCFLAPPSTPPRCRLPSEAALARHTAVG